MWKRFEKLLCRIVTLSFRAARAFRKRIDPKALFYILSPKYRNVIKFTGVGNNEKKVLYFTTFYHFINNIPSLIKPKQHDFLVCQNYLHDEFVNSTKPKVFFTKEPHAYMTSETRKNLEIEKHNPFLYLYSEPDAKKRMFYPALNDEKISIIKRLEKRLLEKRERLCCIINRYCEDSELNLLQERLKYVKEMGQDIDIYGFESWHGTNKWKDAGSFKGPAADKFKTLSKYNFAIAFENTDYPGYITEKIIHSMMAGTVPLYWGGGGYMRDSIPEECYIDCRNRDATEVHMEIKSCSDEKIVSFRKAAFDFLKSQSSEKFTYKYWAMAVVERLKEHDIYRELC